MKTRNLFLCAAAMAVITPFGFVKFDDLPQGPRTIASRAVPPSTTISFASLLARPQGLWEASTSTTQAPASVPAADPNAVSVDTPAWACIGWHESRDNYAEAGGGRWQFENGTFEAITGLVGPAQDYSPAIQDAAALNLYAQRGWEPWTTRWVCGV